VDGAQEVGGATDVVERELEEHRLGAVDAGRGGVAQLGVELVIALAKIVGFDVAPVTALSAISLANSPLSSRSRERVSSQIETPACCSPCRRAFMPARLPRPARSWRRDA
jgi:hypothetical protein